jgi:lipoic acid synthetase
MIINRKKPDWLKIKLAQGKISETVLHVINKNDINTICVSGMCPNKGECWGCGTATFMIAGNICTRSCKFCNVTTGKPLSLDITEPDNIADAVKTLKLKHVVITSVDRDDLADLGANHWTNVIGKIKSKNPEITMETLIPDFQGKRELIRLIIKAQPEVISHNLETVERLTPVIRSGAAYKRSLQLIEQVAESGIVAKSGIMLGLGETRNEIIQTMHDLRNVACNVLTIGQYLQPGRKNIKVEEYVLPEVFEEYKHIGLEKGFTHVESAPLVRSSYHAERHVSR